jgi:hypothetical protein
VLGPLFRFQRDEQKRSELLVVMTPRVIRAPEDYRALSIEQRDKTGMIPDDVKANPLMQGLQVKPGETTPAEDDSAYDSVKLPSSRGNGPRGETPEEYGPANPTGAPVEPDGKNDPDSYDIPVSMLTGRK